MIINESVDWHIEKKKKWKKRMNEGYKMIGWWSDKEEGMWVRKWKCGALKMKRGPLRLESWHDGNKPIHTMYQFPTNLLHSPTHNKP